MTFGKSLIFLAVVMFLSSSQALLINGAGASFPYPIYSKWFSEFQKNDPEVRINYQSIGSGAGIRQIINQTVDFGASDAPMKEEEIQKCATPVLHIPTVIGAVTVSYNLPEFHGELKLTPDLTADIFMGKITRWDDPRLLALNPNLAQAAQSQPYILVVQRSDGSGTTSIFTEYLSKVSPAWKEQIGQGKAVNWPTGIGGKGNEGVAGVIKQNPGTIGYVEMTFALANRLSMAMLQNAAGEFIKPNLESVMEAAKDIIIADDLRMSLTNAPGKKAYPISAFTYLLIPTKMPKDKGDKILKFLAWALKDGQTYTTSLHYAPLPKKVIARIQKNLLRIEKVNPYRLN